MQRKKRYTVPLTESSDPTASDNATTNSDKRKSVETSFVSSPGQLEEADPGCKDQEVASSYKLKRKKWWKRGYQDQGAEQAATLTQHKEGGRTYIVTPPTDHCVEAVVVGQHAVEGHSSDSKVSKTTPPYSDTVNRMPSLETIITSPEPVSHQSSPVRTMLCMFHVIV